MAFDQHTTGIKSDVVIYRLWLTIYQLLLTYFQLSAEAIYSKYEDILRYCTIYVPPDFPVGYFLCLVQAEINYSVVTFSMQFLEDKGSWSWIWPVITSHQCLELGQIWWSIVMSWSYRVKISTQLNLDENGQIVEFKFLRISIFSLPVVSAIFLFKDCQFR